MEKVIINSYEEFEKLVGQQIGVSDYVELSQERINLFADATLDHQWIHVDTERAKVDSPYHSTIAHGYLTLSMLPYPFYIAVHIFIVQLIDVITSELNNYPAIRCVHIKRFDISQSLTGHTIVQAFPLRKIDIQCPERYMTVAYKS